MADRIGRYCSEDALPPSDATRRAGVFPHHPMIRLRDVIDLCFLLNNTSAEGDTKNKQPLKSVKGNKQS